MSFNKNGNISASAIYESAGTNLLINSEKYTKDSPYVVTGTRADLYVETDQYCRVTPGKTYYYTCQTDGEWAATHGVTDSTINKVTIWLYVSEEYNPSSYGYKTPVCFTSSNWVSKDVWKYTIPSGCNMVRVRYNTYTDGTNAVTKKFWDTMLIPAEYFVSTPPPAKFGINAHWKRIYFYRRNYGILSYRKAVI